MVRIQRFFVCSENMKSRKPLFRICIILQVTGLQCMEDSNRPICQGRFCCDACKVPVVQPDHCSSELIGLHRKTTSFTRVCGPKSREETRSCCKCRNRSLSVLLYTLIPLFLLCFTALLSSPTKRKKYHDVQAGTGDQHLTKEPSHGLPQTFRLNLSNS